MNQYPKVKDLPMSERPYEKFEHYGPAALSDAELLAVILRFGGASGSSIQLAQSILMERNQNLLNLFDLSLEELQSLPGIGKVKSIQLKCVAELTKRIVKSKRKDSLCMTDAATVAAYYMEQLRHEQQEQLIVAMFNTKCDWIGDAIISVGSVNTSFVSPREIFLKAFEKKAVYLILLHNHPSGNPTPSKEDMIATEKIAKGGELLGIDLADHIIIGDNQYFSFRERGLLT